MPQPIAEMEAAELEWLVHPPLASEREILVRGELRARTRPGQRTPRFWPGGVEIAGVRLHLPGRTTPTTATVGRKGQFQYHAEWDGGRPTQTPSSLLLEAEIEGTHQHRHRIFTLPEWASAVMIVLLNSSWEHDDRHVSYLTQSLLLAAESWGVVPIYLRHAPDRTPESWRPAGCPLGLSISTTEGRRHRELGKWIQRISMLFRAHPVFVLCETDLANYKVLRKIDTIAATNRHFQHCFVMDTRPLARGIKRQLLIPRDLARLRTPHTLSKTISQARADLANVAAKANIAAAVIPSPKPARFFVAHHQVTRFPVVFCHGMLGYSVLKLRRIDALEYFVGLGGFLEERGYRISMPMLGKTHGVKQRAEQLKQSIDRWTQERVNIIAHSMGGLDARWMITHLGMSDRVASLTTISTPHQGTYFADWFIEGFDKKLPFLKSLEQLGADVDGLRDVTRLNCRNFNRVTPDVPGVLYFSVSTFQTSRKMPPSLRRSHAMIAREEGPNDGLVSVKSAYWGEHLETVRTDHSAVTGDVSLEPFDHFRFYQRLLNHLTRIGL